MKRLVTGMLAFVFVLGLVGAALAAGSAEEAKVMVDKAIVFMKANGAEKAFAEFTNKKGQFVKDDLYIFVIDAAGMTFAHGGNEKLVGKEVIGLKDSDGKFFIKDVIEGAKAKGSGWSDYRWANPVTKGIDKKSTFFKKEGDYIFGCGIYKG